MAVKTVFLGSNWESLENLKELHEDNRFDVVAVITQPDKPAGRKKVMTPTEVKKYAVEHNIPVIFTENKKEKYREVLEQYNPDLVVCIAFGEIVPGFFLEAPKYKAVNIHFSLLPKYRGAVPIQIAILNGEEETGITFVQMVEELDAGPILAIYEESILENDTNQSLRERLVEKASKELPGVLNRWVNGDIPVIQQDNSKASFCYQKDIAKDKAEIKWGEMEPEYIERMVRALVPWPVAWTMFEGKRLKIYEAKLIQEEYLMPAEFKSKDGRLLVGTKNSTIQLEIMKLQPEGKSVMNAKEFVSGRDI